MTLLSQWGWAEGSDPHALDAYLDGAPFGIDEDTAVNISSLLLVAGRMTGREIDAEWLDGVHTCYRTVR
ncbi:hypothetical protein [Acrocarpospora phusangensis]|uniref:hypothetical protein n=1 Tax=Acrocarpospora phusangensis TaxID=1070424 RepID=UPI00194E464C|nr:hypothetical protein [Acrocarpospora phusangensis]